MMLRNGFNRVRNISLFIDFDKIRNVLYNNIYLEDEKVVIKMPLIKNKDMNDNMEEKMKFEKFALENHIYLLSYP